MDGVAEPPPFPGDLPSEANPAWRRGALPPHDAPLTFCLHTVDLRDELPTGGVPHPDPLDERALRKHADAVQAAWDAARAGPDEDDDDNTGPPPDPPLASCVAYLTGQTVTGAKVGVVVAGYRPYAEVELPLRMSDTQFLTVIMPALGRALGVGPNALGRPAIRAAPKFKTYVPDPVNPTTRATCRFARLRTPTMALLRRAATFLRNGVRADGRSYTFDVHEDGIDAEQHFIDEFHLIPSGWHVLTGAQPVRMAARALWVDAEFGIDAARFGAAIVPDSDNHAMPPLLVASLDAEMTSGAVGRFPSAARPADAVVVVALAFAWVGAPEFERQAFVLAPECDPIPGVIVRCFADEGALLAAVRRELFVVKRIDVLTGHNVVGFDLQYLATRAVDGDRAPGFDRFGALVRERLKLKTKTVPALGGDTVTLNGAGFAYVDTLVVAKGRPDKLREYTLRFVAEHVLGPDGPSKFDMPYDLIPAAIAGGPAAVRKLTAYCVQDAVLPLKLLEAWDGVRSLVLESRVVVIPMAVNVRAGQQQRVRNKMMAKAHAPPFCMVLNGVNGRNRSDASSTETAGAVGGWVLDGVVGLHDVPVVCLDFASLYPSVQRANNLCWSTVYEGPFPPPAGLAVKTFVTETGTFHFVQNVPGVFPEILNDLLQQRKAFKAAMGRAPKNSPEYRNANAGQLATKIVMNSGYGAANAGEGAVMPCKAVGTVTCHEGRVMNQRAEAFCRATFGTRTLYGDTDSIMVHFPEAGLEGATRLERLRHAAEQGMAAEDAITRMFDCAAIRTECEKVYFPFLSCGKKTYAGLKFLPDDVLAGGVTDPDLGRPCGTIECKGIRSVRRDVPAFCNPLTMAVLGALFYDRSVDAAWDHIHTATERVVYRELPIADYSVTKQMKSGYECSKGAVGPHVAVSYAREYVAPGTGFVDGDRVPFVMVQEADPRRVIRPPHMPEPETDDAPPAAKKAATGPPKAAYARHIDEILADPDNNHVDVVDAVDKGICSVLAQLMPEETAGAQELLRFAEAVQTRARAAEDAALSRGLYRYAGGAAVTTPDTTRAALSKFVKPLSHRAPVKARVVLQRDLAGNVIEVAAGPAKKPKPRKQPPPRAVATHAKK